MPQTNQTIPHALKGFRVLDLTNVLAGPFCTYQLGLQGAEVIKVEVPDLGDLARQLGADPALNAKLMGASFLAQNGGKKSITVNLKTEPGKDVLRRLVKTADVLVENFRPGVMSRFGLDYENLRKINPALIYCAISGFGQKGPLNNAPAYDQIIQGLSGLMSITGSVEASPMRVGYPVSDSIGGLTAAFAITTALVRRLKTGEGAFLDVSMLDSTIVTMGWVLSNYLIAGQTPQPMGNDNFTAAPSGTFRTKNGLLNIAANKQAQFESLAKLIGREDLISDPRFKNREDRKMHRTALTEEIEKGLMEKRADEWDSLLNAMDVPAGCVLSVPQALEQPQIQQRALLTTLAPAAGMDMPLTVVQAGFKTQGIPPVALSPPPVLGAHTEELLTELGYSTQEIADMRKTAAI